MSHSLFIEDAILTTVRSLNDSDYVDVMTYALLNVVVCVCVFQPVQLFDFSLFAQ